MRAAAVVLGLMLIATGAIWILQGVNVLKGSFMTGQALWGWIGALAVVVGVPLLATGLRRARAGSHGRHGTDG